MTSKATDRDTSRAFTVDELSAVLAAADTSEEASHADVADIAYWLAGTGVRISEALSQRWEDLDVEAGTVLVRGTKTRASTRTLVLPDWLLDRIKVRAENGTTGYVFPSPGLLDPSQPRDRRNVARVIRNVLDEAGCPWATPHTFRRTVATLLDAAGRPIAEAANQLGHANPAMTARVYLGRKGDLSGAAAVLSGLTLARD